MKTKWWLSIHRSFSNWNDPIRLSDGRVWCALMMCLCLDSGLFGWGQWEWWACSKSHKDNNWKSDFDRAGKCGFLDCWHQLNDRHIDDRWWWPAWALVWFWCLWWKWWWWCQLLVDWERVWHNHHHHQHQHQQQPNGHVCAIVCQSTFCMAWGWYPTYSRTEHLPNIWCIISVNIVSHWLETHVSFKPTTSEMDSYCLLLIYWNNLKGKNTNQKQTDRYKETDRQT